MCISEGAKVIPIKQNDVNKPRSDPEAPNPQLTDFLLKKDGKARNIGINIIPTKKKARLKNTKEIIFDSPECEIVRPISLKKFIKKEYPSLEGLL